MCGVIPTSGGGWLLFGEEALGQFPPSLIEHALLVLQIANFRVELSTCGGILDLIERLASKPHRVKALVNGVNELIDLVDLQRLGTHAINSIVAGARTANTTAPFAAGSLRT